jgi:3D (Asp-Asp-Asp) domain-containing protein
VQGSGRLASGSTVSFAKRGCPCAAMCPRTGQQICFERLDPTRFPAGRGATGKPITPFRTVAVDSNVVPLGTSVFIPEFVGLPRDDGKPHDGCFIAEDRGLRVVGRQVDVFMGDPAATAKWNKLFPSNRGVHVRVNEPRCRHVAGT